MTIPAPISRLTLIPAPISRLTLIPAPISRLTLIPGPEPREPRDDGPVVRRYRLMRLRLNGRRPAGERHGHLKRTYD